MGRKEVHYIAPVDVVANHVSEKSRLLFFTLRNLTAKVHAWGGNTGEGNRPYEDENHQDLLQPLVLDKLGQLRAALL